MKSDILKHRGGDHREQEETEQRFISLRLSRETVLCFTTCDVQFHCLPVKIGQISRYAISLLFSLFSVLWIGPEITSVLYVNSVFKFSWLSVDCAPLFLPLLSDRVVGLLVRDDLSPEGKGERKRERKRGREAAN